MDLKERRELDHAVDRALGRRGASPPPYASPAQTYYWGAYAEMKDRGWVMTMGFEDDGVFTVRLENMKRLELDIADGVGEFFSDAMCQAVVVADEIERGADAALKG